ncbi:serine/threonine-protein kinase [Nocardia sp. NPDC051030]|uniref:serine/threonine-protein kinase n=1 Tax=Nocardia sp. NPDC051030 TaxID=3155162 RepID=UPI00344A62A3
MEIAAGTTFAGYRIERELGSGGMGTVYLAQHPRLPRKDAVKVLSATRSRGEQFRTSFLREAELAARLRHPNLVAIRDRGEYDGRLWIAMQYVAGSDLSGLIRNRRAALNLERVVHILSETALGLDEIHRAGLLHRDVKPANILIAEEPGRPDQVLVTDFGIARAVDTEAGAVGGGDFAGTLAYAAPEQFDDGPIDRRADVYALGCTLFQLLTGSLPFPRETPGSVMYAHMHEDAAAPSSIDPGVPSSFDAVVAKAMAKWPDDRYATCGELAAAAREALSGGSPPVARARPRRFGRTTPGVLAAVVVSILAAAAVAVVAGRGSGAPEAKAVSNRPITGTIEPAQWGAAAFIAQTFPDLVPPTPFGGGYQELSGCIQMNEAFTMQSFTKVLDVPRLYCIGNSDPVYSVMFTCNADRTPISPDFAVATAEGDERWTRGTASGRIYWGTGGLLDTGTVLDDRPLGVLDILFDDPARNFCRILVYGNTETGAELRTTWWTDAPL